MKYILIIWAVVSFVKCLVNGDILQVSGGSSFCWRPKAYCKWTTRECVLPVSWFNHFTEFIIVLCCSYCATNRKVAGSIFDGVIGNFHWFIPSCLAIALGSTQLLTKQGNRDISQVSKDGRCVGLNTLPHSCTDCLEIWQPEPPGTQRASPGL